MEVRLLGPLRLRVDGRDVDVPGERRRAALAVLALAAGRTVGVATLVDALWDEDPPPSVVNSLQSHVSRLRTHLGPYAPRLRREPGGYRLDVPPEAVDAHRAAAAADRARRLADDPAAAARVLDEALGAWRGRALEEFDETAVLAVEAVRLEELRLTLVDLLVDARLRSEPAEAVVDIASRAAGEQPLRESTRTLLLRALAGSGRPADALEAARDFRRRLDEETGLLPSDAFAELERAVAAGELGPPTSGPVPTPRVVPRPLTPLLGREEDLARVHDLLRTERCVTLVGPGGVGKTRLAHELAARSEEEPTGAPAPDGVVVVELAQAQDPASTGFVLAELLGVRGHDLETAVVEHLAGRSVLLVLDNCEHVLAAVRPLVRRVLAASSSVHVLATSREPLGVPGEWVHRLRPLPVPAPGDAGLADSPAVRLFRDRAARATGTDPGARGVGTPEQASEQVAEVCRRLDGLPLALELAAAWLPAVGLGGLLERLDQRLDIGPSAVRADDRHGTLRRTVSWSYDLLAPDEQKLFRHLCVVPDRAELELAEHMASTLGAGTPPSGAVARLVDCSMVVADSEGSRASFRVLDSLRAFGLEALAGNGETQAAETALSAWGLQLAHRAATGLTGPDERAWADRLVAAIPALRAARRALIARNDVGGAARLSGLLGDFALWREHSELWAWALETAELPGIDRTPDATAALAAAASGAWRLGLRERARTLVERAEAASSRDADLAATEQVRGVLELFEGRFDEGEAAILRGVSLTAGSPHEAEVLATAALCAGYAGRTRAALERLETAGRLAVDGSPTQQAYVSYVRGEVLALDSSPGASASLRRAVELARRGGASFVEQVASLTLATESARRRDVAAAVVAYRSVVDHWRRTGSWTQQWTTLRNVAVLLAGQGMAEDALTLLAAADAAPDASALAPEAASALERLLDRLRADLGHARAAEVSAAAAAMPRQLVVDGGVAALGRLRPARGSPGS